MTEAVTKEQFRWACNTMQMAALKSRQPAAHNAVKIMADMWTELEVLRLKEAMSIPEVRG